MGRPAAVTSGTSNGPLVTSLQCILFNVRSLLKPGALDSLLTYMRDQNIHVALLTEAWLNENISSAELSLNGYFEVFRRDRGSRGGSVLVLVRRDLACAEVDMSPSSEILAVDVRLEDRSMRFVVIYFSPSGTGAALSSRKTVLVDELGSLRDSGSTLILGGDLNLPHIDWESGAHPGMSATGVHREPVHEFLRYSWSESNGHDADPWRGDSGSRLV